MEKNAVKNYLIGSDVELFLQDRKTKEIVSAEPFIKGSKHNPYQFDPTNPFFSLSLDNVLAEFTIPPAKTINEWIGGITKSMEYVNKIIPKRLCTVALPSAVLNQKYLKSKAAQTFGCDPDNNAWLREQNPPPKAPNPNLRSGGGHIHIGYDNPSVEPSEWLVRAMDLFIGVPSILQEPENERRALYGKAGAFRFKEYGVEYRTVSNYFVSSEQLMAWAFANTEQAISFVNTGDLDELEAVGSQIQEAINTSNKILAQNLIHQFNIQLV